MESPLVVAQRAAIQEARARYERGGLTFEAFRRALNQITAATDASAVAAVVAGLPAAPHSPLAAFDPAPSSAQAVMASGGGRGVARIGVFMGETRRAGKPWALAPHSHVACVMGNVLVDLRQARLPQYARMRVDVVMGQTRILVPGGVHFSARTRVIMANSMTLGEYAAGIVTGGEVEHEPAGGEPVAELESDAQVIMGELKINLVDPAAARSSGVNLNELDIADLAKEVLGEALAGVRDGLAQARAQRQALRFGGGE
jgi:hypothetical protein